MVRYFAVLLLLATTAFGQELKTRTEIPTGQTARQALIEMLTTSSEKVMKAHLPDALVTRLNAMAPSSGQSTKKGNSIISSTDAQFFPTGPVFLVYMPPKAEQKVEVLLDRDETTATGHEFAFSFRVMRDGKEVVNAIVPKLLAQMKQEEGTWRLAQVGFSVQMQLDDGAKLDELMRSAMSAMATASAKPAETTAPATTKRNKDEWVPAKPAK